MGENIYSAAFLQRKFNMDHASAQRLLECAKLIENHQALARIFKYLGEIFSDGFEFEIYENLEDLKNFKGAKRAYLLVIFDENTSAKTILGAEDYLGQVCDETASCNWLGAKSKLVVFYANGGD